MSNTAEIPTEIGEEFKKFRLSPKHGCGVLFSINKNSLKVEKVKDFEATLEELAQELPESAPRYIAYSIKYEHKDGRVSFPLVLIFYCPPNVNPTLNMLYSSTKTRLVNTLQVMKTYDIQNSEELSDAWLKEKLGKL